MITCPLAPGEGVLSGEIGSVGLLIRPMTVFTPRAIQLPKLWFGTEISLGSSLST